MARANLHKTETKSILNWRNEKLQTHCYLLITMNLFCWDLNAKLIKLH